MNLVTPFLRQRRRCRWRDLEMERDAILGHGASFFLKERLCDLSDAFKTVACTNCGNLATPKVMSDKLVCRNCPEVTEKEKFGQVTVPYAFTLLRNLLAGLNINMRFTFLDQLYIVGDILPEEIDQEDLAEISDQISFPDEGVREDDDLEEGEEGEGEELGSGGEEGISGSEGEFDVRDFV